MFTDMQIARVVHEAVRAIQVEQADPTIPVAAPFDEITDEMKQSIIEGIAGVRAGNSPEESHEGWVKFKVDHGWKRGPVKDEEAKEHPLIVPYAELPQSQKVKDLIFVAIVAALS